MPVSDPNSSPNSPKQDESSPVVTEQSDKGPAPGNLANTNLADTNVPGRSASDELAATSASVESTAQAQPTAPQPTPTPQASATTADASSSRRRSVTQLGDFRLKKKLGQGGMGTVYLAKQMSLDRLVAIKTLSKEFAKQEDFVARFLREARSMAKLQHPNVVQVYAADSAEGIYYAAIEYIDGRSMQDWMEQVGQLSVADAVHVILICADALRHAHDMNMIHRDVKPDNILVTSNGVVKVSDFGLAKAMDEDTSVTQTGTGLGTPLYMAPEQARNAKHVDNRSDIYALGATLYYFLTGKHPFTGDSTLELILAKERGTFTSARKHNSSVPERLDLMIDKMMARKPEQRHANCAEIIRDLKRMNLAGASLSFIEGAVVSASVSSSQPTRASARATRPVSVPPERAAKTKTSSAGTEEMWYVRFTDVKGKTTISRLKTSQVLRNIGSGVLGLKAKAKKTPRGDFLPLSQYSEFSQQMEKRAIRSRAQEKSGGIKEIYSQIDKLQQRHRRWRWLRNLFSNIKGITGLIFWLAFLAAVGYGVFLATPYIWKMLNKS